MFSCCGVSFFFLLLIKNVCQAIEDLQGSSEIADVPEDRDKGSDLAVYVFRRGVGQLSSSQDNKIKDLYIGYCENDSVCGNLLRDCFFVIKLPVLHFGFYGR